MIRLAKANPSMDERNPSTIKGVAQSAARRDMQTDDLLSASRLLRHGDGDNRCHERTGQPDKAAAKRSHLILIWDRVKSGSVGRDVSPWRKDLRGKAFGVWSVSAKRRKGQQDENKIVLCETTRRFLLACQSASLQHARSHIRARLRWCCLLLNLQLERECQHSIWQRLVTCFFFSF